MKLRHIALALSLAAIATPAHASDFGSLIDELAMLGIGILTLIGMSILAIVSAAPQIRGWAYLLISVLLLPVLVLGLGVAALSTSQLFNENAILAWPYLAGYVFFVYLFARFTLRYWRQSFRW